MDPEVQTGESVDVPASDDNGNVPVDTPETPVTPSPASETPAAAAEPAEPAAIPVPELIELPDGRKVDAVTVASEYKNLLGDYTRKSQELAHLKGAQKPTEIIKPADPMSDPNYVPQTYGELAKAIQDKIASDAKAKEDSVAAEKLALETAVNDQLAAVKAIDKNVNETQLFTHATKYGFRDLKLAHQNMQDMAKLAKNVQQETAKNVLKRNDPVSTVPGAGGARPDPSNFQTARDYLRSLKN